MKKSKVTVNSLYIPLMTSVMVLLLGLSAHAQFKADPIKIVPVKTIPSKFQKPVFTKPKEIKLILKGDNFPKKTIILKQEVEGPRTGGGNSCALSITQNKTKLISILSDEKILTKNELSKMQNKLETTQYFIVTDQGKMLLNGEAKDAINLPDENTIYLSEYFCRTEMNDVSARSMSLLFHEYLGLLTFKDDGSIDSAFDDRQYQKSGQLLAVMSKRNQANNELIEFIKSQIEDDLNQHESLFKGQMAAFKSKMHSLYGEDLLNAETPQIEVLKIRASTPDIQNKFVSKKYDAYWNPTEDAKKAVYGAFDSFENESYIITVKYKAATLRSFETATKEFLLKKEVYQQEARHLSFAVTAAVAIQVPAKITKSLINKTTYSIRAVDTDDKD